MSHAIRSWAALPVLLAAALAAAAAQAAPVLLESGWVADFSAPVADAAGRSTVIFNLEGSYRLTGAAPGTTFFNTHCVGLEASTKRADGSTDTAGSGRCVFLDKEGAALYAAIETRFDGITFRFDGGTGRWAGARGSVVSKETFTVESERQLRGFGEGKGDFTTAQP